METKNEATNKQSSSAISLTEQIEQAPLDAETTETTQIKRVKPRALVFKAHYQDFCKIIDLIKSQFPEVEMLYITTGPATGILKVTKSVPYEAPNENAFFNVE